MKKWERLKSFFCKRYPSEVTDAIDFEAFTDESVSLGENKSIFRSRFPSLQPVTRVADIRNLEREAKQRSFEAEKVHLREEETRLLSKLLESPSNSSLEEALGGVQLVARGFAGSSLSALVVHGGAGLSKSWTVIRTLTETLGAENIVQVVGHITPLHFYRLLYENNGKCIILDDLDAETLKSPLFVAMLKAASWTVTGQRALHWGSSSGILEREGLPSQFIFTGKIALLCNSLPDNGEFAAFLNRALVKEVRFTFDQTRSLFSALSGLPFKESTPEQRKLVLERVLALVTRSTAQVSLRLYVKALELYLWDAGKWEDAFKATLEEDADKKAFFDAEDSFSAVTDRIHYWTQNTGRSRRSYFYLKKKIGGFE